MSIALYVVLDGSDALRAAVKEFFSDSVIQRCLVHKERNIKGKLSKRHWGEVSRLFTRLRNVQGIDAAEEVLGELKFIPEANQCGSIPKPAGGRRGSAGAASAERPQYFSSLAVEHQCD